MLESQLSDIEFYLKKIHRLEADLASTQDELMAARLRLRTAEDYEIKYELLLKQSHQENSRLRVYEREEELRISELISFKIEERDRYWSEQMNELEKQISRKYEKQLENLNEELGSVLKKTDKNIVKIEEQEILAYKNKKLQKDIDSLEEKLSSIKKEHEKQKEEQIQEIKESFFIKNKEKQENERKIYREKIEILEKNVMELEKNLTEEKAKVDPKREDYIDKLKNELIIESCKSNEEIENIRIAFEEKNEQIETILAEKLKTEEALIKEKKELKEQIKSLEDQIHEKVRKNELELIHLKEKMSKIREEETEELKNQIKKITENFQTERNSWDILLTDKDKEIERVNNKYNEETQKQKEDRGRQLSKIEELKKRLKEYEGEREIGETEHLLKSLRDIEGKDNELNNYENGVTFLDRQLKKTISRLEQKNIEMGKLLKELNDFREEHEEEVNNLKEKIKKDKKYFTDKITELEEEIKNNNEIIRNKDKEYRKKEKDYENKITQITKENFSLKDLVEEAQKDYSRAVENKKNLENSYREERSRGLTSKSDLTMVKKQKWLEMERQKNDLEAIFKEKEEQIRDKHEIELDRLRKEKNNLLKENEELKGEIEGYREQNGEHGSNKENLYSDYHKKMATLNLEISLTKNIYDTLLSAKSRKNKSAKIDEFDRISEALSNSDRGDPSDEVYPLPNVHEPKIQGQSDLERLAMSFNPNQL